jgi:hypothetical protein
MFKLNKPIVDQCIKHIKDHLYISYDTDLIIDPNAENNDFIKGIQDLAKMTLLYNISPIDDDVLPLNFLNINFEKYDKTFLSGLWYDDIHVISFPPPNEVQEFINASCKFAQSISFIMPNKSTPYIFPLSYRRVFTSNLFNKEDMIFQIWMKADY